MDKETTIKEKSFGKIILVTGGQRSGKSEFAEKLSLQLSYRPIYIATAKIYDNEMQERVDIHKQRRADNWDTIEEPLYIGDILIKEQNTVLLDCLTLLSTNWFFEDNEDINNALSNIKMQLEGLLHKVKMAVIVTNEIGMGGISENSMQRKFTDLQGYVNRYVAKIADEVYFMVSGIPVKIK